MIELKQLNKTYTLNGRTIQALEDINLNIDRSEIFGILGKSGAGKSTLLRCVNLLERPTSGQIIVNNINLTNLSTRKLKQERRKIGMIFQHFNLLESRTAFENIALPLELSGQSKTAIKHEVSSLLELIHLHEHKDHYPSQLSGGQKQRVAIARALATKPDILLCDEATSALDANSTLTILNLLREINKKLNVTILLITHELDVIKQICDRVGVLDHGKLIEHGSVIELCAHPKEAVTKQLVQKGLHINVPESIKTHLQAEPDPNKALIVRLIFVGADSDKPIITDLVKKFDVSISILQANIETIQQTTMGFTLCSLRGAPEALQKALAYVHSLSITVEVLGYA